MRKTGEKLQQVFSVLITWGLLLVLFIAYERYFVTKQEAFLKERAFHSLARLSEELKAQVQRARVSTKSYVQLAAGSKLTPEKLTAFLTLYLKDAWSHNGEEKSTKESIDAARGCLLTDGLPSALEATPNGLTLTFSCTKNGRSIYTLDLANWIQDAFQPLGRDFDDVLIADASGDVLFQKSSELPGITDLKPLVLKSGSDSKAGDNPAGSDKPGSNSKDVKEKDAKENDGRGDQPSPEVKSFQKFTETSFFTQTTLAGLGYELFSVPVRMSLGDSHGGKPWRLVVCGLRLTDSFESDSHAIPYSDLIWATLVGAAIFALSWPLAKLRYMSNTERFTPKQGWILGLTILVAATSATLMLLNASYTSQATREADFNLRNLAQQIKYNFAAEMTLAKSQMQELSQGLNQKEEKNILTPDYLGAGSQFPGIYPFFEIAFWVDQTGKQVKKFDVRPAPTPIVNVRQLAYFTRATSDEAWQSVTGRNGPGLDNYYLDPEISITTTQFSPVLAAPFSEASQNRIKVQALSVRPISLVEPVLPPGYGFAIIDADCNVLFHSEAFRNKRENFCQESKGTSELRPWLFGESASAVDISYAGRPERAFITSMTPVETRGGDKMPRFATGPAYLVVFRMADYALTLNLAIVLVCAILLGFYSVLLLIAIGVYLSLRGPFGMIKAPRLMWPCSNNGLKYVQIFVANATILFFYGIVYTRLYEAPLLVLTSVVTCFSILFMVLKLTSSTRVLFRFGLVFVAISFVAMAGTFAIRKSAEDHGLDEWRSVFVLFGIAGTVAVLLSGRVRWSSRLFAKVPKLSAWSRHFAKTNFSVAYTLAVLTVVTAVSISPCIGCFKFAYDAVSEMALKHAEIELSNSLLARRERIRNFYDALGTHNGRIRTAAARRLDASLDRYDEQSGFAYTGQPKLEVSAAKSDTPESPKTKSDFTESINVAIEKTIADAALVFPANSLGSEMSKLGVASSDDDEHSFTEPAPNKFKLAWKPDSRMHGLTVESEYPKWQGLQWGSRVLVLLLWFVLGVWLTRILRKLLLTDVQKVKVAEAVAWNHISDIHGNFLVVGLAQSGKSEWLRSIAGLSPNNCLDLRVELKKILAGGSYPDPVDSTPVVVLDEFDFNLRDRDYNMARLNLLEHLLYESDCRVVLVSGADPFYFLTEGAPETLADPKEPELAHKLLDRWARVLSELERVSMKSSGHREFHEKIRNFIRDHPDCREFALRVMQECNGTSILRKVGAGILDDFDKSDPVTRDWIECTVLEKAGDYYRVLWSGLTAKERLVLYQLALHGWANPKNTGALQQLESKSLIRRMPMYRIINESFRRFVASAGHADEIAEWEKRQKQSTWRVLRMTMIGLAVAVGIWFLHSQAALSQELAAIVAGAATVLTAFSALFGRSAKPSASKPEPG